MKVLLVEKREESGIILSCMLGKISPATLQVPDALLAHEYLVEHQNEISVVIASLDSMFHNGENYCDGMMEVATAQKIPVIFTTVDPHSKYMWLMRQLGVDVLIWPIMPERLLDAIMRAITVRETGQHSGL